MNVVVAVNEKAIEKYVASMKECNVLKVIKNNRTLYKDVIELNPHLVIIAHTLPGKEKIEDIIIKLRAEQKHTRIAYLYGNDDSVRKKFTNFLIENEIYDFHVGAIDEDALNELILEPKSSNDVQLEVLTLDEQDEINEQLRCREEYLSQLRESLKRDIFENVPPGDTVLSEEEIEDKIEEEVKKEIVKELEVQIIERVEEIEKEVIKIQKETVYQTKLIKQQTYGILSLYNTTIKDLFVSNFSYLLAEKIKQKVLLIDFETPFPTLDHHFNIDKHIYINELHSSKKLTGVSGCLSALKKNMLNAQTLNEFVKEVKGCNNLFILTGLYDIDEFDRVEIEDIDKIIEVAATQYDTVIISLNSFPQNAFTYSGVINSDNIVLVTEPTYTNARANISFIKEFTKYHQQKIEKFNIVLWGNLMDSEKVNKLYDGYKVLGKIKENNKYLETLLNKEILTKKTGYSKDVDSYMNILSKFGYFEKKGLLSKIPLINKFSKKKEDSNDKELQLMD